MSSAARPTDSRCNCRSSTSSKSAPAAARSPGSTRTGGLHVGPQQRRRRSGPGLLRQRLARSRRDRCRSRARPHQSEAFSERQDAARRRVRRRTAIEARLGAPLGLSVAEAALGVVTIADAAMSLAVRAVSVNKGVDPRDTAMIAFGGAGPLHAVAIAREIFVPKVVIPKLPGTFSALGMLMASWRQDFVRTLIGRLGEARGGRGGACLRRTRRGRARAHCAATALPRESTAFRFLADLRYVGQEHALPIAVDGPAMLTDDTVAHSRALSISSTNSVTARRRSRKNSKSSTCASF